jgi:hypothetical protein
MTTVNPQQGSFTLPPKSDAIPTIETQGEAESTQSSVSHVGWPDPRQSAQQVSRSQQGVGRALSSRPTGNLVQGNSRNASPPRFASHRELNDVKYPPPSIHGITTRGGEHYVRIEGQDAPERVHYDEQGRLRADNRDGLAPASNSSADPVFKRVAVSDASVGPAPFAWPQRSRLLPGADYSRAWSAALGQPDEAGMFHCDGRRYVEMNGHPGVAVEVKGGADGRLRVVMDDTGKPTGPAVSKDPSGTTYRSAPTNDGASNAAMPQGDPSRFYLSEDDRAIIQRDRDGEDVSPTALAAAQERARQKSVELRDAAYQDLPAARRPPLPPVELPANPSDRQILEAAFQGSSGLVVGENHYRPDAVGFLDRNMSHLKEQGVDTLFLEYDREKLPQLNTLLRLEGSAIADPDLKAQWEAARRNLGPKFDLLSHAVRNGIEIKAVDSWAAAYDGNGTMSVQTRKATMNHLAQMEINKHQAQHGGKWIALVGSGHASDHVVDGVAIPGIASTTGARSLSFFHGRPGASAGAHRVVSVNQSYLDIYGSQSRPDIIVDVPRKS